MCKMARFSARIYYEKKHSKWALSLKYTIRAYSFLIIASSFNKLSEDIGII